MGCSASRGLTGNGVPLGLVTAGVGPLANRRNAVDPAGMGDLKKETDNINLTEHEVKRFDAYSFQKV